MTDRGYQAKRVYGGVAFDRQAITPSVDYLSSHPEDVAGYVDATMASIRQLLDRGDRLTSRKAFEALCLVLEAVRAGQPVNPAGGV